MRFLGQRYPGLKLHSGRVVNGSLKGFEIKSDRDTLKRLGRQSEIYSKVFDTITLVTSECHLTPALDLIPAWWGIEIAFMDGADEAPRLETWRAELENADVQLTLPAQNVSLSELLKWRKGNANEEWEAGQVYA